jgi:hypothetical protein
VRLAATDPWRDGCCRGAVNAPFRRLVLITGRDGAVIRDAKIRYVAIITFRNEELRSKLSVAVIDAMRNSPAEELS